MIFFNLGLLFSTMTLLLYFCCIFLIFISFLTKSLINTLSLQLLIPKSLKTQLYKGIRDSFASEHGARMTAMHKETDNATELRDQLKLTYNKARQAAITNEILEIVGGAEALNN